MASDTRVGGTRQSSATEAMLQEALQASRPPASGGPFRFTAALPMGEVEVRIISADRVEVRGAPEGNGGPLARARPLELDGRRYIVSAGLVSRDGAWVIREFDAVGHVGTGPKAARPATGDLARLRDELTRSLAEVLSRERRRFAERELTELLAARKRASDEILRVEAEIARRQDKLVRLRRARDSGAASASAREEGVLVEIRSLGVGAGT